MVSSDPKRVTREETLPRILILHASFGSGHKRAAQAIAEAIEKCGVSSEVRDLLEFLPAPLSRFYSFAYEFMITKSRNLWRFTYEAVNRPSSPYSPGIAWSQRWQFKRLKNFLLHGNYTHIISTHFTPSALLADWRTTDKFASKLFSVITDHEAHRCWKRSGLNHYFVASEEVAREMMECGVPSDHLTISGIPISSSFCYPRLSRESGRVKWSIPEDAKAVLVLCSAFTAKTSSQMLEEFAKIQKPVRFLVSAGNDPQRENYLKNRFQNDPRFNIFGFSSEIAEMMNASDLVVTKPGGLIISEALAMGVPQILLDPIPGQEEANARFAENTGAAISLRRKRGVFFETLQQLFDNPQKLSEMAAAARKAGKPRAAQQIAETVLSGFVV